MRKFKIIFSLFILFVFYSSTSEVFAVASEDYYPLFTEEAMMDMSKTYSYYKSQKYSVEKIAEIFPEYEKELVVEQLKFDNKFSKSVNMIDSILKNQFDEWEKIKEDLLNTMFESADFSKLSENEIETFVEDIKDRTKGNIPSPILETLLIYNPIYIDNPAREFRDGYKNVYRTKDHPKAKGVDFQIEFPKSWKNQEGLRPNIIQKFKSENGRGFAGIMLLAMKLPVPENYEFSNEELDEFFTDESIKEMIPKGGRFIKFVPTVVEGLKSGMLYYEQRQQRLNIVVDTKTLHFLTVLGNKAINIQCYASVQGENENLLEDRFSRVEPLFMEVINSLVIHDKWNRDITSDDSSVMEVAFGEYWWLSLVISALLTWGVGLLPPVLIRYVIVRRPISKIAAIITVSIFWVINLVFFVAMGSQSRTHFALFLVAVASYYILKAGSRKKA